MVNSPLIRPAISWGGWHWGVPLGSHDFWRLTKKIHQGTSCVLGGGCGFNPSEKYDRQIGS